MNSCAACGAGLRKTVLGVNLIGSQKDNLQDRCEKNMVHVKSSHMDFSVNRATDVPQTQLLHHTIYQRHKE